MIKHVVDFFTEHYSHLIGKETFDEKDYPDGFCKCLNPLMLGKNENIMRDIKRRKPWKDIEKKLEGTGELTCPDSHAPDWKYIIFIICLNFAPFDRFNNKRSHRLNCDGTFIQNDGLMILAGFHPLSAHVIIVNSILWVDILVSQGPATWKTENKTQYDAMAWFQRDAVRDLIEDCANQCVNLAGFLAFGEAAKASILEWARERFAKRGIFMQPKEVLLEHPENISGRRVNPENAIVMFETLSSMLSTVGVVVPKSTTDEVRYHIVPIFQNNLDRHNRRQWRHWRNHSTA